MKFILSNSFFLLFISISLHSQEICDNGIDDDGDGFIDLWDSECVCGDIEPGEIEGDFEEYSCCPSMFTIGPGDGIYCLDDGWELATGATADYVNTCGYLGGGGIPMVPMPIPSGDGAVGQITLSTGYTEYVGLCLECTFLPGAEYDISFEVGFSDGSGWLSSLDVEYALYGTDDCGNLDASGIGCLLDEPGWYEIETFDISASAANTWESFSGSFTSNAATMAIAIGPSCDWAESHGNEYHFLDDVVIEGDFLKESEPVDIELEGDCVSGVTLESEEDGVSVQWFLDGIAIDGATDNPFLVDPNLPGDYQVLVDFGGGECSLSEIIEVDVDLDVLEIMGLATDVDCPGNENGEIVLNVDSPNLPLNYEWTTGDDSSILSDLPPGSYTVTVTDDNGCFSIETYVIDEPTDLTVDFFVTQPIGMGFGEVEIFPNGGTPEYEYLWDNGNSVDADDELLPGEYEVIIIDANGCEQIIQFEIFEPFNIDVIFENESCFNYCDGTITLDITGGQLPYDIEWNNLTEDDDYLTDLCPDIYYYTVTDAYGTEIFGDVEIEEAPEYYLTFDYPSVVCSEDDIVDIEMDIEGGIEPFEIEWSTGSMEQDLDNVFYGTYSVTVTDATQCQLIEVLYVDLSIPILIESTTSDLECAEGAEGFIDLEVEGGEEPYEFDWSNGEDSQDIDGLLPGTYYVTVTDVNDCTATQEITINSNSSLEVSSIVDSVNCQGGLDGSIEIMIEGGTMPYDIEWSTGDTESVIEGLIEGNYSVTVTDALNCVFTSSYEIQALSNLQLESTVDSIACNGVFDGVINLDIEGGLSGLSFNWSNGELSSVNDSLSPGVYSLEIIDSLNCSYPFSFELLEPDTFEVSAVMIENDCFGDSLAQISLILPNAADYSVLWSDGSEEFILDSLLEGFYEVDVIDPFLCVQSYSFEISDPNQIAANAQLQNPDCLDSLGGSIILDPTGGDGNYSYLWGDGELTDRIENLSAGNYPVTITDGNGCTLESVFTLIQEASIEIDVTIAGISCYNGDDGAISFDILSGNSPFDISWSNGDAEQQNDDLTAGIYYLNIIDADNCLYQDSFLLDQPEEIVLLEEIINPLCSGDTGTITVEASGGTGQLNLVWSNGDVGNLMDDLAGDYDLMIEDENGCQVIFDFELTEPDLLQIDLLDLNFPTQVGNDGLIIVEGDGGTQPYEYLWSNGTMIGENTGLGFGAYSVTVTDANGCQDIAVFDFDPDPLTAELQETGNLCSSDCEGTLSITIENGLEPYEIEWSTGEQSDQIENLCAGEYSVTVQDGLDSVIVISNIEITSPGPFVVDITSNNESCLNLSDGNIQLVVSGATPGYDIEWSNGEFGDVITNLSPGTYEATIIDQNGCQLDTMVVIDVFNALDIDVNVDYKNCEEAGAIISFEYDDTQQVDFLLNGNPINLSNNNQYELFEAGNFDLSYQVSQSCEIDIMSFEVEEVFVPLPVYGVAFQSVEFGDFVTITPDLGEFENQNIVIEWQSQNSYDCQLTDQNGNCESISVLAEFSESILLLVEDEDGCQYLFDYQIDVDIPDLVTIPNIFSPNNDGENDEFSIIFSTAVKEINSFKIYDRWGNVVYDLMGVDPNNFISWNGRMNNSLVSQGVYIYALDVIAFDDQAYRFSGDLTLIR